MPCPGCGYNLRGLAAARCPECERGVALCVEGTWARPRQRGRGAFLLGVILAGLAAQFVLWVVGVGMVAGLPEWLRLSTFVLLSTMAAEGVVLAQLILALRRARAAGRWESIVGWGLAWLAAHAVVVWASVAFNLIAL